MRLRLEPASLHRFAAEARRHDFRFTCADCLHELRDGSCAHEWPNDEHRRPPEPAPGATACDLVFCKEFEAR